MRVCNCVSQCSHSLYHSPDLLHKPQRKVFLLDTDVIVPKCPAFNDQSVLTFEDTHHST